MGFYQLHIIDVLVPCGVPPGYEAGVNIGVCVEALNIRDAIGATKNSSE